MNISFYYPLKVWATTLAIGTLLFCMYGAFLSMNHSVFNGAWVMTYLISIIVGGLFSSPALGIFYLYFFIMSDLRQLNDLVFKLLMAVFNVLICFLTFYAIRLTDHHSVWKLDDMLFILCYVVPLIASVLFYKVES